MDRFSTLQLFVRVVECESFTRAARELNLGQPAVSKQIAGLETWLGTQLLSRTSRGLRLTAAGQDLYDSAVRILDDFEEAESRITRSSVNPSGLVKLATPPGFASQFIIPRLPDFLAEFPGIAIDISVAGHRVDLVREGIDIALRVDLLSDSSLMARKIGSVRHITVATPDYLARHGTPQNPAELKSHKLVVRHSRGAAALWRFKGPDGEFSLEPSGNFASDDSEDIRSAILAGLGIGHSSRALFASDLASGRLVQILDEFAPDSVPIHVLTQSGRRLAQRFRVVIDFLANICASELTLRIE
ncbi:LysR family transcriptional regulator [Rhizobium sp. P38BS-XIX]|uniref:LysR family transcriptional regulator n=1 Tax=Rhizobium sp. P38BS-XIX TaxID=2726740 RepID=UPI001456C377|nr:LysR family transcriptional regulator [Rhizobium sp. P38BS-XIX]NLS01604.1 LysR family transcriptional regulator [Rhizobium sp. P38BS-XIX]